MASVKLISPQLKKLYRIKCSLIRKNVHRNEETRRESSKRLRWNTHDAINQINETEKKTVGTKGDQTDPTDESDANEQEEEEEEDQRNVPFEELGVDDWLIHISKSVQIYYATKIQRLCLPLIMQGKNVVGSSETGSGKTICYCWSILQELNRSFYGVFALILLPTRELTLQVAEQFILYGKRIGVKVLNCIGGFSLIEQRKHILGKPNIVIGTPGRISDILENCIDIKNCFKRLRYLVLDEADLLLQQCFEEKLKIILNSIPKNPTLQKEEQRRTLFFSATITESIQILKETFPNDNLIVVNTNKKQKPPKNLNQRYIYVEPIAQITYLVYLLQNDLVDLSGIIFVDNSYNCQLVSSVLNDIGMKSVDCIHSQKEQTKRISVLSKFKNGMCKILVATDLISRGIDIPKVAFVINFDFPNEAVQYIHRVGRTARANRKGIAISFIDSYDVPCFEKVKRIMKKHLKPYKINKQQVLENMLKIGKVVKKWQIILDEQKKVKQENEQLKQHIFREWE